MNNAKKSLPSKLYRQKIHQGLGRTYYNMTVGKKIETTDNKIEQSKAQYDLDRKTKISTLSSGNVSK